MPNNITTEDAARLLSSLRRTHGGGRKKKLRKCRGCGARLGVREMRAHKCEGVKDAR
jgi:hypothetical protein